MKPSGDGHEFNHCGLRPCTVSGLQAPRPRRQPSESGIGAAIAGLEPKQGYYPVCRLLVLLKKNPPFGSFPVSPYLGTFRRLLWAFYRKLLGASYGVLLCQPQIAPDRMQRLSDKLDCNSSAIVVAGDISALHRSHLRYWSRQVIHPPIKKALEGAGTDWVVID